MPRFSTQQSYASCKLEVFLLTSVLAGFVSAQLQSITSTSTTSSINKTTISPTPTTSVAMPTTVTTTKPPTYNTSFEIIIEFVNITWRQQLLIKTSTDYISLEKTISKAVESAIMVNISNVHVQVLELKPGSVLAFLKITTNKPEFEVQETLRSQMTDGTINGLPVSKTLFSGRLFDVVLKIPAACDDSQQLKGFKQSKNLTSAVQDVLPGNVTATVQKVSCPDPQNITIVTVRLQVKSPSSKNPSQELSGLKKDVENGKVGNLSLIPEWQAYIPGEKLFSVSFDLASPSENINKTITDLGKAIKDLLRNESYFSYVTVELMNDNSTVILKVGMKTAAPEQPKEALQPLQEGVKRGKLGSVHVKTNSFKAYINPNTLTQRVFEIHFRLNLSGCADGAIKQNHNARNAVKNYLESNLKNYKSFIKAEFQSIDCVKGQLYKEERFVQAVFLVYLKPDASDKHRQFVPYLYKCREYGMRDWGFKVVTLTPTSASAKGYTHYVCGRKPKTTTVQTTRPTREPSSSGTPPVELYPSLYVKLRLGITWGEFCSKLEHSLKQKIAWNLYDRNGTRVSPDRIIFINVRKSCADPSKKNEQAVVWFYVSKSGPNNLHKCLTLKAYRVLKMFLENGNTKQLGPEFEGKVIHVDLVGEDSSDHKADFDSGRLSTLAVILIAIAGAVGLLLLTLAFCCLFCCGANRRRRRKREEDPKKMQVVRVDANGTDGVKGNNKKGKGDKDEADNDEVNKTNEVHDSGKQSVISHENQAYSHGAEQDKDDHNSNKPVGGPAPVIVTSPAPDYEITDVQRNANMGAPASDTASSDSGGSRKGSASIGGERLGSDANPPSPGLRHIDTDLKDRGRRRSSTPSIIDDEDMPLTHKTGTVGIVALALRNRNENKKEAEFKNLSKDVPEEEVKYPANTQSKNRSADVLPAPRTRVKLSSTPDYINANWIRDHQGQRRYIATQHPLYETAEDFWRMVWEQESRLVVMVNEEEKEKLAQFMNYLPKGEGNTKCFGSLAVTIRQISKKPDYTLTILSIADSKGMRIHEMVTRHQAPVVQRLDSAIHRINIYPVQLAFPTLIRWMVIYPVDSAIQRLNNWSQKASSSREISHMKFTSWKERAMPNVALFVGFVTATREERKKHGDTKAPIIVHCSDGLGFTGVYIAVDIGIKSHEESKTSVVDVFELSKNLRRDRHGIVCSLKHYNFIYQALYEYTVNYDESAEAQKR